MTNEKARFMCLACKDTEVFRDVDLDEEMPVCMSCDEAPGGENEMGWIEDVSDVTFN
jgi:hypothetical protein